VLSAASREQIYFLAAPAGPTVTNGYFRTIGNPRLRSCHVPFAPSILICRNLL
jgi:hypothetical protein